MSFIKKITRRIGPGVITGAADDDPSGIATYSQTGAQFGYGQLWTSLFTLPLLIAIQEACARIGAVTGKGIAANIKSHYHTSILYCVIALVFVANTINIGADIGAMVAATQLLIDVNFSVLTILYVGIILALIVFVKYNNYAKILKWLCLSLLAYPLTLFIVSAPWGTLLKATLIPHFEFTFEFLLIMTAVLGTTISPYLFFWQASQEVEEVHQKRLAKENEKPHIKQKFLNNLRIDNFLGMVFSQIGAWAIIVVTATVLHTHGVTDIKTAADAAKALEPLVQTFPNAGYLAKLIFATGIIGLGILAIPVLAGSTAYAISEAFHWQKGINLKLKTAPGFYGVIIVSTLIGLCINYLGIDPIKALIYSAVINGIVAVPLILMIALIANNKKIMGRYKSKLLSNIFVWITFFGMFLVAICLLFTFKIG